MKAWERRNLEAVLSCLRGMLVKLERIGPESDSPADLDGYGEVKDYLLDRIEHYRVKLERGLRERSENRKRKPFSLRLSGNDLPPVEMPHIIPPGREVQGHE